MAKKKSIKARKNVCNGPPPYAYWGTEQRWSERQYYRPNPKKIEQVITKAGGCFTPEIFPYGMGGRPYIYENPRGDYRGTHASAPGNPYNARCNPALWALTNPRSAYDPAGAMEASIRSAENQELPGFVLLCEKNLKHPHFQGDKRWLGDWAWRKTIAYRELRRRFRAGTAYQRFEDETYDRKELGVLAKALQISGYSRMSLPRLREAIREGAKAARRDELAKKRAAEKAAPKRKLQPWQEEAEKMGIPWRRRRKDEVIAHMETVARRRAWEAERKEKRKAKKTEQKLAPWQAEAKRLGIKYAFRTKKAVQADIEAAKQTEKKRARPKRKLAAWREEARRLGITFVGRKKVDVLADIEAVKKARANPGLWESLKAGWSSEPPKPRFPQFIVTDKDRKEHGVYSAEDWVRMVKRIPGVENFRLAGHMWGTPVFTARSDRGPTVVEWLGQQMPIAAAANPARRNPGPRGGFEAAERAMLPDWYFLKPSTRGWPAGDPGRGHPDLMHANEVVTFMIRGFGDRNDYPWLIRQLAMRYPPTIPEYMHIWNRYEQFRQDISEKAGVRMPTARQLSQVVAVANPRRRGPRARRRLRVSPAQYILRSGQRGRPKFALNNPDIKGFKRLVLHLERMGREKGRYVPILAWGESGVGKSESVKRVADELGIGFVDLRLGQQEVGDLIGFPHEELIYPCTKCIHEHGDSERYTKQELLHHMRKVHGAGRKEWVDALAEADEKYPHLIDLRMVHTKPDWFPKEGTRGILFLDELNRGNAAVLQAIFQLILERRMHLNKLPDGWIIVAAVNPATAEYSVLDIYDKAFLARFLHVAFEPTRDEWLDYASKRGVDWSIRSLVSDDRKWLGDVKAEIPDFKPTPRTWVMFSDVLEGLPPDLEAEVARGLVGTDASVAWQKQRQSADRPIKAAAVLSNYPAVKATTKKYASRENNRSDLLNVTLQDLARIADERGAAAEARNRLSKEEVDNLIAFLLDCPTDLAYGYLKYRFIREPHVRDMIHKYHASGSLRSLLERVNKEAGITV